MERHKTKSLKPLAKNNRTTPTEAERKLWHFLRNNNIGLKFRRQQQIGPYIADFICFEKGLIVECDGSQHYENAEDEIRTKYLQNKGYRVLRFWNMDVLKNTEGVCVVIKNSLTPHPNPLPQGEREKNRR